MVSDQPGQLDSSQPATAPVTRNSRSVKSPERRHRSMILSRMRLAISVQPSLTKSSSANPPVWSIAKLVSHYCCHPGLGQRTRQDRSTPLLCPRFTPPLRSYPRPRLVLVIRSWPTLRLIRDNLVCSFATPPTARLPFRKLFAIPKVPPGPGRMMNVRLLILRRHLPRSRPPSFARRHATKGTDPIAPTSLNSGIIAELRTRCVDRVRAFGNPSGKWSADQRQGAVAASRGLRLS